MIRPFALFYRVVASEKTAKRDVSHFAVPKMITINYYDPVCCGICGK